MSAPPHRRAAAGPLGEPAGGALLDAGLDLLRGSTCVGCGARGRMLCPACRDALPGWARPAGDPVGVLGAVPGPAGGAPVHAAVAYAGAPRALVLAHKERGARGLRRPLAALLALTVADTWADTWADTPPADLTLVPVPPRPGTVRRRGEDPTGALVRAAAGLLRERGGPGRMVRVARLLVSARGVQDQAGLGAAERAVNVAGSMHCPAHLVRRLARASDRTRIVLCDDVLTTGATLGEAERALRAAGLRVSAGAVVAATPPSGPSLSPHPPTG